MRIRTEWAVLLLLIIPHPAAAYAGLGPLVPMIGSGIMLIFLVGVTFLGIVTYPAMTVLEKVRKKKNNSKRGKAK